MNKKLLTIFGLIVALCLTFAVSAFADEYLVDDARGFEEWQDPAGLNQDFTHARVKEYDKPGCTKAGFVKFECEVHGGHILNLPALGHTTIDGTLVQTYSNPTCKDTGLQQWKCGRCGELFDVVTATVDHNWLLTGYEGDCKDGYLEVYACEWCGLEKRTDVTMQPQHEFKVIVNVDIQEWPTCIADGTGTYESYVTCRKCGRRFDDPTDLDTLKAHGLYTDTVDLRKYMDSTGLRIELADFLAADAKDRVAYRTDEKTVWNTKRVWLDKGAPQKLESSVGTDAPKLEYGLECIFDHNYDPSLLDWYDGHQWDAWKYYDATCARGGYWQHKCTLCHLLEEKDNPDDPQLPYLPVSVPELAEWVDCYHVNAVYRCANCEGKLSGIPADDTADPKVPEDHKDVRVENEALPYPAHEFIYTDAWLCTMYGGMRIFYDLDHTQGYRPLREYPEQRWEDLVDIIDGEMFTKAPTCTEPGTKAYICFHCYDEPGMYHFAQHASKPDGAVRVVTVPALGHSFGEWTKFIDPDPANGIAGYWSRTCSVCNYNQQITSYEGIEAEECKQNGGHVGKIVTETPAACGKAGEIVYQCENCGFVWSEYTDALEHDYVATVTEPTCTESGYTTNVCSLCGDTYTTDVVAALGHDWEDVEATETTTAGKKCTRCGETEGIEDIIPNVYKIDTTGALENNKASVQLVEGTQDIDKLYIRLDFVFENEDGETLDVPTREYVEVAEDGTMTFDIAKPTAPYGFKLVKVMFALVTDKSAHTKIEYDGLDFASIAA